MKRFMNKKVATIGLAAGLALGAAGAAFAYFTSTGQGTGSATTGLATTGVIISDDGPYNGLVPGSGTQDVTVTAAAPTGESAYVSGISAYLTVAPDPTYNTGTYTCTAADYSLDGHTGADVTHPVTIAGWTAQDIGAGHSASTSAGANTIAFNDMTLTNQDDCQGATVTINYSSN